MMYLSKLELRKSPSVDALQALLNPAHDGRRMDAHHRLIWTAFAGDPDAERSFLWREDGAGSFLVLSRDRPQGAELFEEPQVKPFEPNLRIGDQLNFRLRVNATRTVKTEDPHKNGSLKRKHRDVVMMAMHPIPRGQRAEVRQSVAREELHTWLQGQGTRAGFKLIASSLLGYRDHHVRRGAGKPLEFGIADLDGQIEVNDPTAFLDRLAHGFGRAKAFGCGLMLIRRA